MKRRGWFTRWQQDSYPCPLLPALLTLRLNKSETTRDWRNIPVAVPATWKYHSYLAWRYLSGSKKTISEISNSTTIKHLTQTPFLSPGLDLVLIPNINMIRLVVNLYSTMGMSTPSITWQALPLFGPAQLRCQLLTKAWKDHRRVPGGPTFATTVLLRHLQKIRNRFQIRTINAVNLSRPIFKQAGTFMFS